MAPSRTDRALPPPEEESTPPPACPLLYELVLEIIARSDVVTFVRSAATCKALRRDILSPALSRRVCRQQHGPNGGVPRFLVGYLRVHNHAGEKRESRFSLVHPATPATASFSEDHMAQLLCRTAADSLSRRYMPLTSRNGLAVLRRGSSRITVYDPMKGVREYHWRPLDPGWWWHRVRTYVLLTAADGIGCSFFLLATHSRVEYIQAAASMDATDRRWGWGPLISVTGPDHRRGHHRGHVNALPHSCAVVLDGLIHWLMCVGHQSPSSMYILTYDIPRIGTPAATTTGSIELPKACLPDGCERSEVHLTTSPDGKLSLLVADWFTISVWLLSRSGVCAGRWARHSVIDTEAIVRSVSPHDLPQSNRPSRVDFMRSSAGLRSGVVLLRPFMSWDFQDDKGEKGLLLVDVRTQEMRRVNKKEGFPYEVDMEARLSAMKIFD